MAGTPNTSGKLGRLYGVILHGSRSGRPEFSLARGDGSEGRKTLAYIQTAGTTSYSWLIDYDGTIWEVAGWDLQAWHAGSKVTRLHLNTNWLGLAFAQSDVWEPLTGAQYNSGRWLLREIGKRTGIPLTRLNYLPDRYAAKGVCQHQDAEQGRVQGKTDIGPLLQWDRLGL